MNQPSLEIRVEAIGGAGINAVALAMTNMARALSCTVVCDFQPGTPLVATPQDSAVEVARQLPGYEASGPADKEFAKVTNEQHARRARMFDRFERHVENIDAEIKSIRELFQQWGGH